MKFLVKNIFIGKTHTNHDLGSTRPQTSNSKSFKSLNYSKNETFSDNKKNFISRPNSSMVKLQNKIMIGEFSQAGYLNYADIKENHQTQERKNKAFSAKTEVNKMKNSKCELFNPEVLGKKEEIYEKYPQFYDKLQRNLMKDLKKY